MNREEIEDKLKEIILDILEISFISLDDNFQDDLHIDSLDSVEIIMEIEDRFHILISDEDESNITDIRSIIDIIEKKVS